MKRAVIFFIVICLTSIAAQAKIITQHNADGTISYTNVLDHTPKKEARDDPNVGDVVGDIKVLGITTKVVDSSKKYFDVAIRVKIKNMGQDPNVSVEIEGVDSDDFQREHTFISGRIPPGETGYISDLSYVEKPAFNAIKIWRVK